MLQLVSQSGRSRGCDGMSRRTFLRSGAVGIGGLALTDWLRASLGEQKAHSYLRDRAVVLLFLAGGPSQYETFDPKPDGPGTSTSIKGHLQTSLAGVRFASYFPKLARLADRLTIVRSFKVNHAEHNGAHKQILTADLTVKDGKPINQPGLGAIYARAAGAVHPVTGMPRQALIPPTTNHLAKRAGFVGSFESVVEGVQPAGLGATYSPFTLRATMREGTVKAEKKKGRNAPEVNPLIDDLTPRLAARDLQDRVALLEKLDRFDRRLDAAGTMDGMDRFTRQAANLLRTEAVRRALDLSQEPLPSLEAYDTEHFRNYNADEKSKFIRTGPSIGISLGRQLLLARRLVEAGCGFVTVIHSNWDMHARKNIPNIPEGMGVLAPPMDHAVAAFLTDIEQRGLDQKILLVITGEFGRTPNLDKNLGRHHWPRICPLVFAGGGLKHGQVVGQSDRRGGEPASTPITISDLHTTLLNYLFDLGKLRLDLGLPKAVHDRAQGGRPIADLF